MNAKTTAVALMQDDEKLLPVLRNSIYPGAADDSIRLAISYCRAQQLDPLQKPVHIVPMWDSKAKSMRDVIMPGVNLYRTQAARSGALAGVSEPEFGPDVTEKVGGVEVTYPAWCRVVVKRRLQTGEIAEFAAVERWKENYAIKGGAEKSVAPNAMWARRPYGQLAKCSQAQALRIAFPEFSGAYTAEELEGKPLNAADDEMIVEQPHSEPLDEATLKAWELAAAQGTKAATAFWKALPAELRKRALQSQKDEMWGIAEQVDLRRPKEPPPEDEFTAALDAS